MIRPLTPAPSVAQRLIGDRPAGRLFDVEFWSKVDKTGDCWIWQGSTWEGYGLFHFKRSRWYAHRIAYELLVGPITEGFQLDHLCRNPPCVNPAHLEPVTPAENMRRGIEALGIKQYATHCPHGHAYDEINTWVPARPGGPQGRKCKTCGNASRRLKYVPRSRRRAA